MSHVKKARAFLSKEYLRKPETGMDKEIQWSSAEMGNAPPEWVAEVVVRKLKGRNINVRAHSQILRIRAEDSYLEEDKARVSELMVFTRPLLPASPLGGKAAG